MTILGCETFLITMFWRVLLYVHDFADNNALCEVLSCLRKCLWIRPLRIIKRKE